MQRHILAIGKVITFLGIAMYLAVMPYLMTAGERVEKSGDGHRTIIWFAPVSPWIPMTPFVTLSVGSILWSIGQRSNRASN